MALAMAEQLLRRVGLSVWEMMEKTCLEIGSGDCFLGHVCNTPGINLISLDNAPGGFPGSYSFAAEVPFVKADATSLPFPPSCFDLVISMWSPPTINLFTLREIKICCDQVMRVLKEGGEFRFAPDIMAGKYYQAIRLPRAEKDRLVEKMDDRSEKAVRKKSRMILQSVFPAIIFSQDVAVDYVDSFRVVRKRWGGHDDRLTAHSRFAVILTRLVVAKKINVIKVVREITGLGLKEAKDMVEAAPMHVKENASMDEALKLKKQLEDVGALVEIK